MSRPCICCFVLKHSSDLSHQVSLGQTLPPMGRAVFSDNLRAVRGDSMRGQRSASQRAEHKCKTSRHLPRDVWGGRVLHTHPAPAREPRRCICSRPGHCNQPHPTQAAALRAECPRCVSLAVSSGERSLPGSMEVSSTETTDSPALQFPQRPLSSSWGQTLQPSRS